MVVVFALGALAHLELAARVTVIVRREHDALPSILEKEKELVRELERARERRGRHEDVDELGLARQDVQDRARVAHLVEIPAGAEQERMLVWSWATSW